MHSFCLTFTNIFLREFIAFFFKNSFSVDFISIIILVIYVFVNYPEYQNYEKPKGCLFFPLVFVINDMEHEIVIIYTFT